MEGADVADPEIERRLDDPEFRFGAWLVTCHPDVYDLAGLHAAGHRGVANWRVRPSYRTDRMQPGDRIVLWMEEGRGAPDDPTPGVWGVGRVVGPVEALPVVPSPRFAWMDRTDGGRPDQYVETDLRLLDEPLPAAVLAGDEGFAEAEVLGTQVPGNPLVLSQREWDALAARLPAGWPDPTRWPATDPAQLPPVDPEPLDSRFEPVRADEVGEITGLAPEVVERVLVNQFEELEACYLAGDLIVTDLSYYCTDDDLLARAQAVERDIDADAPDAVDRLIAALEELAEDRLVLAPNDLVETPGFLDGTGASEAEAELVLDTYWDLVLEEPARLDPFWLAAAERGPRPPR